MLKILLACLLFTSLQSSSQTTVSPVSPSILNAGGGSAIVTSDFIIDWSVGESTVIETFKLQNPYPNSIVGSEWYLTSGILQPFDESHIIFNVLVPGWTNQELHIYPIPTPDIVVIDFRSETTGKISIELLSIFGSRLGLKGFSQVNGAGKQTWNLTNMPSGAYYLRILLRADNGKILKQGTFKIAKIK
jgi:hypothetical protein